MKSEIQKCRLVLFAGVWTICVCLVLQYWGTLSGKDIPAKQTFSRNFSGQASSQNTTSDFIYMTQTESCLPDNLLRPGVFGDGCKNDVLVLSWKQPCTSNISRQFKHIKYIYNESTTWSTGRNILYEKAKKRPNSYLYYIFIDDDLIFNFLSPALNEHYRKLGFLWPLSVFEDFLLKHEPAIGVPMYCRCSRLNERTGERKAGCCDPMIGLKPLPEYLPVTIHFDAAFTAFHKIAADLVLPYRLDYEDRGWWHSQKFLILAADLIFRGQVLRFSSVTALNILHRKYPREDWENWTHIYNILKAEMPKKYRNQTDWAPNYKNIDLMPVVRENRVFTAAWNLEIPTGKITVEPFKHFNNT